LSVELVGLVLKCSLDGGGMHVDDWLLELWSLGMHWSLQWLTSFDRKSLLHHSDVIWFLTCLKFFEWCAQ